MKGEDHSEIGKIPTGKEIDLRKEIEEREGGGEKGVEGREGRKRGKGEEKRNILQ